MSGYQATKAALPGLCRSLTAELGPLGIRINTLMPGWIDTPFNDPSGNIRTIRTLAHGKSLNGVSIQPGMSVLIRMPSGPSSAVRRAQSGKAGLVA